MSVTLDAPAWRHPHAPDVGHGPVWNVGCDLCRDRLYLAGYSAKVAAQRAEREFGWRRVGRLWLLCRRHEGEAAWTN